jgi:hypothetical protein
MTPGTAVISYSLGSCIATVTITVNASPTVTAIVTPDACGNGYTIVAGGAVTYSWSPATGLSCATCSTVTTTPSATVTYMVTGTNVEGCTHMVPAVVNGNRIVGHITFSTTPPPIPDLQVWLMNYNPSDSTLVAVDSTFTCLDGAQPFFRFNSKPAGSYMVKAKLLSSMPGTSNYVPTYGASTPHWFNATTITHTNQTNVQDINMVFGTVASGVGAIGGYVYSGAASGEVPEAGVLVLLKNAVTGQVLTFTYTNAAGIYLFNGLAMGDYIVYPEEFDYYTTPSASVTLTSSATWATDVTFKKHTGSHLIYPFVYNGINAPAPTENGLSIHPNPARDIVNIVWPHQQSGTAEVTITDLSGRTVLYRSVEVSSAMPTQLNTSSLTAGMYFVNVLSSGTKQTSKLVIE